MFPLPRLSSLGLSARGSVLPPPASFPRPLCSGLRLHPLTPAAMSYALGLSC